MRTRLPSSERRRVSIGTVMISHEKISTCSLVFSVKVSYFVGETANIQIESNRSPEDRFGGRFITADVLSLSMLLMNESDLTISKPLIRRNKLFFNKDFLIWENAEPNSDAYTIRKGSPPPIKSIKHGSRTVVTFSSVTFIVLIIFTEQRDVIELHSLFSIVSFALQTIVAKFFAGSTCDKVGRSA